MSPRTIIYDKPGERTRNILCWLRGHRWSKTPVMKGDGSGQIGRFCRRCDEIDWIAARPTEAALELGHQLMKEHGW